jgi:DNA-binding GntR family transcriptional regulator
MPPKTKKARTRGSGVPGQSASQTAYSRLVDDIIDGVLRPGQRMTEGELAISLGLGKTPVREALRRLVVERLVVVHPRNGYSIPPVTLQGVEELCELRLVVEPAVAAMSAGKLSPAQLEQLETLAQVSYDAGDRESLRGFLKANREFHGIIASACGNARLAALVDSLHFESYRIFQVQLIHYPNPRDHLNLHQAMVAALREGNGSQARRLSEREITTSRHFIVNGLMRSPALQFAAVME